MFRHVKLNEKQINTHIANDREKYKKYFVITLEYIKSNNLVISAPELTEIGHHPTMLTIYSTRPFKDAVNIANSIADITKYTHMRTVMTHKEFVVYVESRPLINVLYGECSFDYGEITVYNITVRTLNPIIELANYYHCVYNPQEFSNVEENLNKIKKLTDELNLHGTT